MWSCSFYGRYTPFSSDRHAYFRCELRNPTRPFQFIALSLAVRRSLLAFELQRPHIDSLEIQIYRTVSPSRINLNILMACA